MGRLGVAVDQHDCHGLDAGRPARLDHGIEVFEPERLDLPARRIEPAPHLEAMAPLHEGRRLAVADVEHVRPVGAAELQHVAEARRVDQGGSGSRPFRDGVDHGRAAMNEVIDRGGRDAGPVDRIEHAALEGGGGGQDLG